MRLLSVPIALLLGLLLVLPVSAAATTAFTGEWTGNDPAEPNGDGSVVHMYITGGTQAKITFTDEFGSVCENVESPVTFFRATLTGKVDGDILFARFHSAHCGPVPVLFIYGIEAVLELDDQGDDDPANDTLWDGSVLWHRV